MKFQFEISALNFNLKFQYNARSGGSNCLAKYPVGGGGRKKQRKISRLLFTLKNKPKQNKKKYRHFAGKVEVENLDNGYFPPRKSQKKKKKKKKRGENKPSEVVKIRDFQNVIRGLTVSVTENCGP